ncbi:MAG TPA: hypothetical protein VF630_11190 [Hymenobacter sp.]|jgi:hypothetical protein
MAHLLSFRISAAVLLGSALLAGCCANDVCDCNDSEADAIRFRFSADTSSATGKGFRLADVDTIILERSPLPYNPAVRPETAVLYRRRTQVADTLVLNNNAPFPQKANTKLNAYRYVVSYLTHPPVKGVSTPVLVLDSVKLSGNLEGNGCCTCYTNTRKAIYTGGNPVVRDLQPGDVVELTKP